MILKNIDYNVESKTYFIIEIFIYIIILKIINYYAKFNLIINFLI